MWSAFFEGSLQDEAPKIAFSCLINGLTMSIVDMVVSWNRSTPKSSMLLGCSPLNQQCWGPSILGKHHIIHTSWGLSSNKDLWGCTILYKRRDCEIGPHVTGRSLCPGHLGRISNQTSHECLWVHHPGNHQIFRWLKPMGFPHEKSPFLQDIWWGFSQDISPWVFQALKHRSSAKSRCSSNARATCSWSLAPAVKRWSASGGDPVWEGLLPSGKHGENQWKMVIYVISMGIFTGYSWDLMRWFFMIFPLER